MIPAAGAWQAQRIVWTQTDAGINNIGFSSYLVTMNPELMEPVAHGWRHGNNPGRLTIQDLSNRSIAGTSIGSPIRPLAERP